MNDKPLDATGFDSSRGVGKHDFKGREVPGVIVKVEGRAPERQPFWAHCSACRHEWIAFYCGLSLAVTAKIATRSICPSCGSDNVICGKAP
jgi:hypothetical protein